MKIFKLLASASLSLIILWSLSSCEQNVTVESVVHEDGAIDRTIIFTDADSGIIAENMFGLQEGNGWETELSRVNQPDKKMSDDSKRKYVVAFHKRFASAEESNEEMNTPNDTIFRVRSEFEKEFKWFYTYMKYSDTYISLNRFRNISQSDFFTPEDYAFINRLPAEGESISKADSLYMVVLNAKIYDHFAIRAIYEEHFVAMLNIMISNQVDPMEIEKVKQNKEKMFQILKEREDDFKDDFMISILDSLKITIPSTKIKEEYRAIIPNLESRTNFMSTAMESKFSHVIKLPWNIINTNADSINGGELYWQPPVAKFMLSDYTMYAESRRPNYWALTLSAIVIVITLAALLRKGLSKK